MNKYVIYCDLDGVLVSFDEGYYKLTGVHTHHADSQGNVYFWRLFKTKLNEKNISELEYWSSLDWMPDGKLLWNYIKKYNPHILTAPSRDKTSEIGKTLWVEEHINNEYDKLLFKPAKFKSDYSKINSILIDDRQDTIDRWNYKGGIGIFHIDASNTINELKQLGL